MMSDVVLVTGSAGRIGRAVVSELERKKRSVRGFDRIPNPYLANSVVGDLGDRPALDRAMQGVECLVHLAATPDDADFVKELAPNNLIGLYHVMEAAKDAGVRRIVLASSGQVNWWQQPRGPWPIRVSDPVSPRYWYAATKMFLESIGLSFSEVHGLSVIVARLGWCPRDAGQVAEIRSDARFQDVYLSPGDAGRFFASCVDALAKVRYTVVYATSKPRQKVYFDLEPARKQLGYEPLDTWPTGVEVVDPK